MLEILLEPDKASDEEKHFGGKFEITDVRTDLLYPGYLIIKIEPTYEERGLSGTFHKRKWKTSFVRISIGELDKMVAALTKKFRDTGKKLEDENLLDNFRF